jgi:glycosyltransferase involved in cell wall biosynthesis
MRVLLGVPWYFPESVGGTEIYVRGLSRELLETGVDVAVAAPAPGTKTEYVHDGVHVFRFEGDPAASGELNMQQDAPAAWDDILDRFAPNIVDLHSMTSLLGLPHLRAAHRRGMSTVATLHVPGVICARGTFMRYGKTPCSGNLAEEPCTACRLEAQGVPSAVGRLLGHVPPQLGVRLRGGSLPAAAERALTARSRDDDRRAWLDQMVECSDRLVAPSAWLADVLRRNGVPSRKVVLCRQGVDVAAIPRATVRRRQGPLRVGFVGRSDPVKGLDILLDAVRVVPRDAALELHIWAIARSTTEQSYREAMIRRAHADTRVTFHDETTDHAAIYEALDVLAVPSVWLETGPLVVLEAQAAGLPVVGSNLGGIAERVKDGEDGILVAPGDPAALAEALTRLAVDTERLEQLRPQRLPRSVGDVVADTLKTYTSLLTSEAHRLPA